MKVKDLIELLGEQDPESDVQFAYNYGDHWRTTVAATIDTVEVAKVVHSAYHSMDKVVDDDGDDDTDDSDDDTGDGDGVREVVLLS